MDCEFQLQQVLPSVLKPLKIPMAQVSILPLRESTINTTTFRAPRSPQQRDIKNEGTSIYYYFTHALGFNY